MRKAALLFAGMAVLTACARNPFLKSTPPAAAFDMASPLYGPNFLHYAASANLWEIQSSRLALQVSGDPAVRSFAEMIIADHTRLAGTMAAAGKTAGTLPPPPEALMPADQTKVDQLQSLPAASFDTAYRDMQVAAHQQAIALFQNYAAGGDNSTLRSMASQAIPMLQKHLAAAEALPVGSVAPLAAPPSVRASRGERG